MIRIVDKEKCVGCNACVQRCPKSCIEMHEDEQGFLYPQADAARCIDCGLCEKVCPVIHQAEASKPRATYAAKNRNEAVRRKSSSGGVFNALAIEMLEKGDCMAFGARFDETWGGVRHDRTEVPEGVEVFQTSKYLQSRVGECFRQAEEALKSGRKVLFSGTPCQIAGLRLFLGKEYGDRLLLVDIACHGVPSPRVWRDYLQEVCGASGIEKIESVCFRDKRNGWDEYGVCIRGTNAEGRGIEVFKPMSEDLFMQGFLKDLYLRPSCYACPAKEGKSRSDITLADFWGIQTEYPELYAGGFHSLILARTPRGEEALRAAEAELAEADYDKALRHNPALTQSSVRPEQYGYFWQRFAVEGLTGLPALLARMRPSFVARVKGKIRRVGGCILRKSGLRR